MRPRGFTLIELLLVIAIIGLLASIILTSLMGARSKGRDANRITSIQSLQTALELYNNTNGHYPISASCGATSPNASWCNSKESMVGGHWIRDNGGATLSAFISTDPNDPSPTASPNWTPVNGGTYFYYSAQGTGYMIVYGLENYPSTLWQANGVAICGSTYNYGAANSGIITIGVAGC